MARRGTDLDDLTAVAHVLDDERLEHGQRLHDLLRPTNPHHYPSAQKDFAAHLELVEVDGALVAAAVLLGHDLQRRLLVGLLVQLTEASALSISFSSLQPNNRQ